MQQTSILLCALFICFTVPMQAQTPVPKPDPAVQKLQVLMGHWTVEEEGKAGPWGPEYQITLDYDSRMILGGFFLQGRWTVKGLGDAALEIIGYDPVTKNFTDDIFFGDGNRLVGVVTVSGNTWTWIGKGILAGKPYQVKGRIIFAADSMSLTAAFEASSDGKTWMPWFENKHTKTKAANR